jgi:hypothetical protein
MDNHNLKILAKTSLMNFHAVRGRPWEDTFLPAAPWTNAVPPLSGPTANTTSIVPSIISFLASRRLSRTSSKPSWQRAPRMKRWPSGWKRRQKRDRALRSSNGTMIGVISAFQRCLMGSRSIWKITFPSLCRHASDIMSTTSLISMTPKRSGWKDEKVSVSVSVEARGLRFRPIGKTCDQYVFNAGYSCGPKGSKNVGERFNP